MRWSIEFELLDSIFELDFSPKDTTPSSGTPWPGANAYTRPPGKVIYATKKSELRLRQSHLPSSAAQTENHIIYKEKKPSRTRSLCRTISKMLSVRSHRTDHYYNSQQGPIEYMPEVTNDAYELPCSQGYAPELQGSPCPRELAAQSNSISHEQQYCHTTSPPRSSSYNTATLQYQYAPSQTSGQANGSSWMTPSFSMSPSRKAALTDDRAIYPSPITTNDTAMSHSKNAIWSIPSPNSATTSYSVSPTTPVRQSKAPSDYYLSPLYGDHEPKFEASPSVSSGSSHHISKTDDYASLGTSSSMPSPPMTSPPNADIAFNSPKFSPAPHNPVQSDRSASQIITAAPPNQILYDGRLYSCWERYPNSISRSQYLYDSSLYGPLPVVIHNRPNQTDHLSPKRTDGTGRKRSFPRDIRNTLFPPIPCEKCDRTFTGAYQKGNLKRHMKSFHSMTDTDNVKTKCRYCPRTYKRADACRKHEWKKHRSSDSEPRKRRIEKQGREKRIYMPTVD